jgi:hypothetical protein
MLRRARKNAKERISRAMKQPLKVLGLQRTDLGDQMLLLQLDRRPTDREIKQLEARLAGHRVLPAADDGDTE